MLVKVLLLSLGGLFLTEIKLYNKTVCKANPVYNAMAPRFIVRHVNRYLNRHSYSAAEKNSKTVTCSSAGCLNCVI